MRDTASTMRCRACGEEVGSSFLYSADGFAYHHECFPGNNVDKADARDAIAAKNAEISRLAADNEALRAALSGMIVVGEAYLPYDGPNGPCSKRLDVAHAALGDRP